MKYVLIDLDKTLLEINFDEFLKSYFSLLIPKLKRLIVNKDSFNILNISVDYMINEKNGELNIVKFYKKFTELSELGIEEAKRTFLEFYINDFPKLSTFGKPTKNGKETVIKLIDLGYKIILATNSIFPEIAIFERMKWADVIDINFELVTTMENMHFAKPHSEYYLEILEKINAKSSDVIMVGDDLKMDILPARNVGIKTIHFGFDIKDISDVIIFLN